MIKLKLETTPNARSAQFPDITSATLFWHVLRKEFELIINLINNNIIGRSLL